MQGYLTLATGSQLYFEAAATLALSVKLNDPSRPISLLCDDPEKLPKEFRSFFDQMIELPPHRAYSGCGDKIRMPLFSPYAETMFMDSDCIVVKADMDRHWQKMSADFWGMLGENSTDGHWYGKSIKRLMRAEGVPFVVQMNSGVFYFRQGVKLNKFVAAAMAIAEADTSEIQIGHKGVMHHLADEPIWGVLMARRGIRPIEYRPEEGIVSVSTYLAKNIKVDAFGGACEITKSLGFRLWGRFISKGWVRHYPSVPHFVAFGPHALYAKAANELRRHFKMPFVSLEKK